MNSGDIMTMRDARIWQNAVPRSREDGIDAMRLYLMPCVIIIHLLGGNGRLLMPSHALLLMTLCNAAVPAFFVCAGYFLRSESRGVRDIVLRPIERLLPIYLFWLLIYYAAARLSGLNPDLTMPYLLTGGPGYHLWFLPALAFGLTFVGLLRRFAPPAAVWAVVLLLAFAALVRGSYHLPLHLPGEPQRSQLLAAPLLLTLGVAVRSSNPRPSLLTALIAAVIAYALAVSENVLLAAITGLPLIAWPCTASTFLLGVAMLLVGRSLFRNGAPSILAGISRITLGIYAVHLLVIYYVVPHLPVSIASSLGLTVATTLGVSIAMTMIIATVPAARRFVS